MRNVEKGASPTRPAGPTPVAMAAPLPPRGIPASHRLHARGRSLGLPGLWSRERSAGHVQEGRVARVQGPASCGQWPRPARPHLCGRHIPGRAQCAAVWSDTLWELRGAAVGRGRGAPRPCHAVTQWPWGRPAQDPRSPGARRARALSPLAARSWSRTASQGSGGQRGALPAQLRTLAQLRVDNLKAAAGRGRGSHSFPGSPPLLRIGSETVPRAWRTPLLL